MARRPRVIFTERGPVYLDGRPPNTQSPEAAVPTRNARHSGPQHSAEANEPPAGLLDIEAQTRRRFATVLHNDLQPLLTAANFNLGTLKSRLRANGPETELIRRIEGLIDEALAVSRDLAHDLYLSALEDEGLVPALGALAERMQEHHGIRVNLDADPAAEPPDERLRMLLYRAVQELLLNVAKHAGTDRAEVRLARLDADLVATVEDEGDGFDPSSLEAGDDPTMGIGLHAIRERVASVGGCLKMQSIPGRGSRVSVVVPVGSDTDRSRPRTPASGCEVTG